MTLAPFFGETSQSQMRSGTWPDGLTGPLNAEDQHWVDGLTDRGPRRERTCSDLYAILLRAAKFELRQRSSAARVGGTDLDDIAYQAASDALLSVMRRAREFRGDSKFTTWATRFVAFEVTAKLRQHVAAHRALPLLPEHCAGLVDEQSNPDHEIEARDLADAVLIVVNTWFSAHQRAVFFMVLTRGLPAAVAGRQIGLNANTVYQTVFRARQCLRSHLLAQGFLA